MTIIESLQALSGYPISRIFVVNALNNEGIDNGDVDITAEMRQSRAYKAVTAKVYQYLSVAPNVTQNGISYSLTADDKRAYKRMAQDILADISDGTSAEYGYIGDSF